jgi:PAS domain S-box-containing protein
MDKLESLENLVESLFNNSLIGLYIVQDGCFKVVSVQFARICGYSEDELIGRPSLELVLPEDRDMVRENAIMTLKGESSEGYEFRIVTKTGETRTIFETIAPVQYLGKRAALGNFVDITERKQAEEALRESEERFAKVFLTSPDAITIVAADDSRMIDVNEGFTRFTGCTREEAIGKTPAELGLWAKPEEGERMVGLLKKTPRFFNEEFACRTKSGEARVGLFSTEVINIGGRQCRMSVIKDITERKQAEEALRESEERFAKVFRTSPDAITIVATDDSRMIDVNEGFTRFTGCTREEAIGKTPAELDLWAKPEEGKRMVGLLKKNTRFFNEEFACRTKSGEARVGLFSTEVINIGGRQCRMSVIKDITERKKLEEEQARLIKELQESLAKVNTLSGLLPICAWCKKLRDDEGYWKSVEDYVSEHTGAEFTHGMCPECQSKYLAENSPQGK